MEEAKTDTEMKEIYIVDKDNGLIASMIGVISEDVILANGYKVIIHNLEEEVITDNAKE